jgi:simple sugar transport system substrate-binding protein
MRRSAKTLASLLTAGVVVLGVGACSNDSSTGTGAKGGSQTYYWINHGSASDPFWIGAAKGATQAGKDLGVSVKESFHDGDVAAEKEAIQAAIAAHADGIAISSPKDGALVDDVKKAEGAGIPVVFFNTDDPSTGRDAYVGANLEGVGVQWAQYLVDHDLVKKGDKVWMPVEVPGATYQTEEEKGIKSVLDPVGVTTEVFNASSDPAQSLSNMTDYLTANADKVDAVIGMGDLVMGNVSKAFKTANISAGSIPVVGWGNTNDTAQAVKDGYVNAATWQFPDAQGYLPIALLKQASDGFAIGFDVPTQSLYEKSDAQRFIDLTASK